MSNVLVIKSHPLTSKESRTLHVLDVFLETYEAVNPTDTVTILDIYEEDVPEIDLDMLTGWNLLRSGETTTERQMKKITRFNELTEQFLASDKIIVANPLWNLNIPTRLKAWIDTINVAGKTFKYTETGPVPLTEGKKMIHIQSSGGIYAGQDFSAQFVKTMFEFVGVTDTQAIFIEGIDHHPETAEETMAAICESAKQAAATF